jgi:hypothetical protein
MACDCERCVRWGCSEHEELRKRAIEVIEGPDGKVGYIVADEEPSPPWDWDELGTVAHWHRGYDLGGESPQKQSHQEFLEEAEAGGYIMIPFSMYEHGGITLYAGHGNHAFDGAGWDSGPIGYLYTTPERVEELCGKDKGVPYGKEWVEKRLEGELQTLDDYYTGSVYGYTILDAHGEHVDSCWGYYPSHEQGDPWGLGDLKAEVRNILGVEGVAV